MHRAFAAWLSQQPWRAALLAACFGVLSPQGLTPFAVAAGAVPAFVMLRGLPRDALSAAVAGAAAVVTSLLFAKQSWPLAVCFGLSVFGLPLALAALLRQWGSLTLVFQLSVVLAFAVLSGLFVALEDPTDVWEEILGKVAEMVAGNVEIDAELLSGWARTMWGTYLALWLLNTLCAVFLARWWQSLVDFPGGFGSEFRELRLGKALGLASIAAILGAMFSDIDWVDSLSWVAITALAFQGLAAAHRQKATGRMKPSWLVAIYVFLIMPFFSFLAVSVLAGWGLADNWRRLKVN